MNGYFSGYLAVRNLREIKMSLKNELICGVHLLKTEMDTKMNPSQLKEHLSRSPEVLTS